MLLTEADVELNQRLDKLGYSEKYDGKLRLEWGRSKFIWCTKGNFSRSSTIYKAGKVAVKGTIFWGVTKALNHAKCAIYSKENVPDYIGCI
jgi:hypothetical protein